MSYDYDLFVIGGGSGGLATAKKAAVTRRADGTKPKVGLADFVKPSPQGTTWGIGGTCVNVGCIPKKLFHFSGLAVDFQSDFASVGWEVNSTFTWEKMVNAVNDYIRSINWAYKNELKAMNKGESDGDPVKYYNSFATFVDPHTIKLVDKKGKEETVTADKILIAVGGRPSFGDIPGAEECCITSDDIFWRKTPPGKTLVVGASYIALETAGFLNSFAYDTTIMVRSILLRGFDQQIADMIGAYMEHQGCKFIRKKVPEKFEKMPDGKVKVYVEGMNPMIYDTVVMAVGRKALAGTLNLEAAGVNYDPKTGKIPVENEVTNVPNIYAIGDVIVGKLELTPVAIQAGKLLIDRIYGGKPKNFMDYTDVATAIFTPLEYGAIGYSEEDAVEKYGRDALVIYHKRFKPTEWNCNEKRKTVENLGYFKVICLKNEGEKVVGIHMLGPNAGEMTQGFAVAMKCGGLTKEVLDNTVGIHPVCAEWITILEDIKVDGEEVPEPTGC